MSDFRDTEQHVVFRVLYPDALGGPQNYKITEEELY